MIKLYFIQEFRILFRILKRLNIAALVPLVVAVLLMVWIASHGSVALCVVCVVMMLAINYKRRDKEMLHCMFGKRFRLLFIIEYLALCVPFVVVLLCIRGYVESLVLITCACVVPWLRRGRVYIALPSYPLYLKGSAEYRGAYRQVGVVHLLAFVACIVGMMTDNINLGIVSTGIWAVVYVMTLATSIPREYILHYSSASRYIGLNVRNALWNTLAVMFPFIIVLLFADTSLPFALKIGTACIAVPLAALQTSLLRLHIEDLGMIFTLIVMVGVLAMMVCAVVFPPILLLCILITIVFIYRNYFIVKQIIRS